MHWVYTVLLIVISAGTVGFGGYLIRRLFTVAAEDAVEEHSA